MKNHVMYPDGRDGSIQSTRLPFDSILMSIVAASSELVTSSSLAVVIDRDSGDGRGKKCAIVTM